MPTQHEQMILGHSTPKTLRGGSKATERLAELLDLTNKKFVVRNDQLWSVYNNMAQPYGPASRDYSLPESEAESILKKLGAPLIRWGNGFSGAHSGEWYAMTLDQFRALESLKASCRQKIRKGLSCFRVERVDAKVIAKCGYEVYRAAFQRYKNVATPLLNQGQFYNVHVVNGPFDDIIHYWGVFHHEKLIAFAMNHVYDDEECFCSILHLHPGFLRAHPSEALYYSMNRFYLGGHPRVRYINAGLRNILHTTNIQTFLANKFHFRQTAIGLSVLYGPLLKAAMNASYPLRRILEKASPQLKALYTMESIRRAERRALENAGSQ